MLFEEMRIKPITKEDPMSEDYQLPFDPTQLLNYLSNNTIMIAIMIAIILLATLVTVVGLVKLKNSIVPVGIAIIAACQVVQVIQIVYPQ